LVATSSPSLPGPKPSRVVMIPSPALARLRVRMDNCRAASTARISPSSVASSRGVRRPPFRGGRLGAADGLGAAVHGASVPGRAPLAGQRPHGQPERTPTSWAGCFAYPHLVSHHPIKRCLLPTCILSGIVFSYRGHASFSLGMATLLPLSSFTERDDT